MGMMMESLETTGPLRHHHHHHQITTVAVVIGSNRGLKRTPGSAPSYPHLSSTMAGLSVRIIERESRCLFFPHLYLRQRCPFSRAHLRSRRVPTATGRTSRLQQPPILQHEVIDRLWLHSAPQPTRPSTRRRNRPRRRMWPLSTSAMPMSRRHPIHQRCSATHHDASQLAKRSTTLPMRGLSRRTARTPDNPPFASPDDSLPDLPRRSLPSPARPAVFAPRLGLCPVPLPALHMAPRRVCACCAEYGVPRTRMEMPRCKSPRLYSMRW